MAFKLLFNSVVHSVFEPMAAGFRKSFLSQWHV